MFLQFFGAQTSLSTREQSALTEEEDVLLFLPGSLDKFLGGWSILIPGKPDCSALLNTRMESINMEQEIVMGLIHRCTMFWPMHVYKSV